MLIGKKTAFPRQRKIPTMSTVLVRPIYLFLGLFSFGFYAIIAISKAQVKKELAEEEEKRLASGGVSLHNTSAASFIVLGLEIEDTQCVFHSS